MTRMWWTGRSAHGVCPTRDSARFLTSNSRPLFHPPLGQVRLSPIDLPLRSESTIHPPNSTEFGYEILLAKGHSSGHPNLSDSEFIHSKVMSKNHLLIAGWIVLPAVTFALGWTLKPTPEAATTASSTTPDMGTFREVGGSPARARSQSADSPSSSDLASGSEGRDGLSRAEIEKLGRQFKENLC